MRRGGALEHPVARERTWQPVEREAQAHLKIHKTRIRRYIGKRGVSRGVTYDECGVFTTENTQRNHL